MLRSIICIFTFAALFQIAVCDIKCFLLKDYENSVKLMAKLQTNMSFDLQLCRPVRDYFEAAREAAKECKTKRIHVTDALAFTKDLCTVGWDLNNRYLAMEKCFGKNLNNVKTCLTGIFPQKSMTDIPQIDPDNMMNLANATCKKLDSVFDCFNEKMGKPCEDEGLALTKNLTTAVSSYTTGLCAEVDGASTIGALSWSVLLGILVFVLNWNKF